MAAFIRNKQLYVLNDGVYEPFYTIDNEVFLTADPIDGLFSFNDYYMAVTSPISARLGRIYLLNEDETIKLDVTEYVIDGCDINMDYSQGITTSSSLTFINTDGTWTPSPVSGYLWKGTKFRIDAGLYYNNSVFWNICGIFVAEDPVVDDEKQTVQIQLHDKFSLLDGTVGGTIDSDFKIPVGTTIQSAIEMCLTAEKENKGKYDIKPAIFLSSRATIQTPYTITKSPGITYGEIIKELADMISCDVYYGASGNLIVSGNSDENPFESKAVLWSFDDTTPLLSSPNITMNLSKVVNKVTVLGAIENGYRYKGVAINNGAESRTNIYITEPNPIVIEDSNIIGDELCLTRAKYELQKQTLLGMQIKCNCMFIPTLAPNNLITWTNKHHNYLNEKFFINSVSYSLLNPTLMNISLTNVREVSV